jgi:hypothetical protein
LFIFFGVLVAAFLMATWAAILARQDLKGEKTGRLLLYMVGMVLTFNLGRDITLITVLQSARREVGGPPSRCATTA